MKEKLFDMIVREFNEAEIWATAEKPEEARNLLMYLYGIVVGADILSREPSDLMS